MDDEPGQILLHDGSDDEAVTHRHIQRWFGFDQPRPKPASPTGEAAAEPKLVARSVGEALAALTASRKVQAFALRCATGSLRREEVEQLVTALAAQDSVTSLDLSHNRLCSQGMARIAYVLQKSTNITAVSLCDTATVNDAECVERMAFLVSKSRSATDWDLSANSMGDRGVFRLACALSSPNRVTSLILRENRIGDLGAQRIAELLECNTKLMTLDLSINCIRDTGACMIARALEKNYSLTMLDMGFNGIGESGLEKVVDALEKNCSILSLDLDQIAIECGHNQPRVAALIERNQVAQIRVLTVRAEVRAFGKFYVDCTSIGGEKVASLEVDAEDSVSKLRAAVAAQVRFPEKRLRFVLPNGALLLSSEDSRTLAQALVQ
mmetsp:Transcript_56650/g.100490  ORF Transcript_56650/g.100490 Transcript_56650/m.100490 type:complete len:381 (-) Transcript_56650:80-1222(-)